MKRKKMGVSRWLLAVSRWLLAVSYWLLAPDVIKKSVFTIKIKVKKRHILIFYFCPFLILLFEIN